MCELVWIQLMYLYYYLITNLILYSGMKFVDFLTIFHQYRQYNDPDMNWVHAIHTELLQDKWVSHGREIEESKGRKKKVSK